jgi:hypothetical protein
MNLAAGKRQLALDPENHTAICEPRKCGNLDVS